MYPVCQICKEKQTVIRSSMWNLSYYQMSPRVSLIDKIKSHYYVTSIISMVLDSWIPYPNTLYLLWKVWLKTEKWRILRIGSRSSINCTYNVVFKIIQIHDDSEFEPLWEESADLVIFLNCMSKKEHVSSIEWFKDDYLQKYDMEYFFAFITTDNKDTM